METDTCRQTDRQRDRRRKRDKEANWKREKWCSHACACVRNNPKNTKKWGVKMWVRVVYAHVSVRNGTHSRATCQNTTCWHAQWRAFTSNLPIPWSVATSRYIAAKAIYQLYRQSWRPAHSCVPDSYRMCDTLLLLFSFTIFYDALVNSFDIGSIVFQR